MRNRRSNSGLLKSSSRINRRVAPLMCEPLEERRLMSLTISLQLPDGSSSFTVTPKTSVVEVDVIATITSSNGMPSEDGLQDVTGQFISTIVSGHGIDGELAVGQTQPFYTVGAAFGTRQDLNGDGNPDIGGTDPNSTAGDFIAKAATMLGPSAGTIVGNSLVIQIATLDFEVTDLNLGGTTQVNFVPAPLSAGADTADWLEGSVAKINSTGTVQAGTPFTISGPANDIPPTAVNDTATTEPENSTTIPVLYNDDIISALNESSVTIVTVPQHGIAIPQTNGEILYTPATGFAGNDSFTYTVADVGGEVSNAATVSITVGDVNSLPPTLPNMADTTPEDTNLQINLIPFGSNAFDVNTPKVTVAPTHGTLVKDEAGEYQYIPTTGYVGPDSFYYTAANQVGAVTAPVHVSITVTSSVAPVANSSTFAVLSGNDLGLDLISGVTVVGAPLDPASITLVSSPTHGTAIVDADGNISYTSAAGYLGDDTFTYAVKNVDGQMSNVGTITLQVIPKTANISISTVQDSGITLALLSDANAKTQSVSVPPVPISGQGITLTYTGLDYGPGSSFYGNDSFPYQTEDAQGNVLTTGTISVKLARRCRLLLRQPPRPTSQGRLPVASTYCRTCTIRILPWCRVAPPLQARPGKARRPLMQMAQSPTPPPRVLWDRLCLIARSAIATR